MENLFSKIEFLGDARAYQAVLSYHRWRHRIPLCDGFVTPGYLSDEYWDLSHFPTDLKNKSFLDIGSNDGINSFRAERLGASLVTGIDLYSASEQLGHTIGWSNRGCNLAKESLHSKVDFRPLSAYDVKDLGRSYQVVLMADVMNWLPDTVSLIRAVSGVCEETLVIRDGLTHKKEKHPILEYVHTPTYDLMFLPNKTFMEVILKQCGFKDISFHKINVDKLFDDWVMDFPLVTSTRAIPVFEHPWSDQVIKQHTPTQEQALSKIGERLLIRSTGWVNVADIQAEVFQPRGLFRHVRRILGDPAVVKMKAMLSRQRDRSYTIIAHR